MCRGGYLLAPSCKVVLLLKVGQGDIVLVHQDGHSELVSLSIMEIVKRVLVSKPA